MKNAYFCFLLCFLSFLSNGQTLRFEQNKGQWEGNILFKARLQKGALFVEKDGLVFHLNDVEKHQEKKTNSAHAFKIEVKNSLTPSIKTPNPLPSYSNYFVGKEKEKWACKVRAYQEVVYQNIFNNIDWRVYSKDEQVKHEFIVNPNGVVEDIVLEYKGLYDIKLKKDELILKTCLGEIIEEKPYAYQIINGKETPV